MTHLPPRPQQSLQRLLRFLPLSLPYLTWLLTLVGWFLSLWIIIPAPIFALLPLSVGTPEISPWLLGLNGLMLLWHATAMRFAIRSIPSRRPLAPLLALLLAGCALLLSALPLAQLPSTLAQANQTFTQVLGPNALATPNPLSTPNVYNPRPQPFVFTDSLRGIPIPEVRIDRHIPFAHPDGIPLTLNLYRPLAASPNPSASSSPSARPNLQSAPQPQLYPGLITLYGGAWQRGSPDQNETFNRYLAAQGYAVWAISYRHAPRYPFPAQRDDVRSALTFIAQQAAHYNTDLNRIALMGRSAGAQLAMLAAYQDPSPIAIKAIINYYGPVNLIAGYNQVPSPDPIGSRATLTAFLGGSPSEVPDRYDQASPINAVKPGLPPSLLIYGGRDNIIRAEYGQVLAEALQAQGNPVIFITIPWADHVFDAVFSGISNQVALYYTERFLAATL